MDLQTAATSATDEPCSRKRAPLGAKHCCWAVFWLSTSHLLYHWLCCLLSLFFLKIVTSTLLFSTAYHPHTLHSLLSVCHFLSGSVAASISSTLLTHWQFPFLLTASPANKGSNTWGRPGTVVTPWNSSNQTQAAWWQSLCKRSDRHLAYNKEAGVGHENVTSLTDVFIRYCPEIRRLRIQTSNIRMIVELGSNVVSYLSLIGYVLKDLMLIVM